ncbi:MAG: hypothetical protein WCE94_09685 [Candidatus Methanoperedens sp.]
MGIEEELQKEKLQNSRDFKEITLAIALLAGLSGFLLKLIDYFNNHSIPWSYGFQRIVYISVYFLLIEFLLIFAFLISKGYLVSTKSNSKQLIDFTQELFKFTFVYPVIWSISSISTLFASYLINYVNGSLVTIYVIFLLIYLLMGTFKYIHGIKKMIGSLKRTKINISFGLINTFIVLIIFIPIVYFTLYNLLLVTPSYLLMGSFFIDVFPQSDTNHGILTFTIKETGLTSGVSFVNLYKLNAGNNSLEPIDNITIPLQNTSLKKLMFGGIQGTNYYINLNASNLSSGNYMMHAEVTFDITKNSTFGVGIKHDDKLFYIAPRIANYSSYSTQELKRIETTQ